MKLQDIRDIIRIVQKYEPVKTTPSAMGKKLVTESQIAKFHELLVDDIIREDSEAAVYLYGNSFSPDKYKSLKTYFLKRTINNIAFLDISRSSLSEHPKAVYKAYK